MISLTTIEYDLDEQVDKTLSRLKWAVEEVEPSWLDIMNWSTAPATRKDWIGGIDKEELKFSIQEPGSLFKPRFNVVLKGRMESRASKTSVKVKLGLQTFAFIFIFMIYIFTSLIIYDAFEDEKFNSFFPLIFFLVACPILETYLITRRMKRAEKKLDKLFRITSSNKNKVQS